MLRNEEAWDKIVRHIPLKIVDVFKKVFERTEQKNNIELIEFVVEHKFSNKAKCNVYEVKAYDKKGKMYGTALPENFERRNVVHHDD